MRRLLPDVYWSPTGRKGIIDTGKTIEFWLKPCGYKSMREIVEEKNFIDTCRALRNSNRTYEEVDYNGSIFSHGIHTVTLVPDINSNGAAVAVHMKRENASHLFNTHCYQEVDGKVMIVIGQVPSNSNIHKIIVKKLDVIKPGRIVKLQADGDLNIKVRFPYGIYTYNNEEEIVIDHRAKVDGRFRDLMVDEDK